MIRCNAITDDMLKRFFHFLEHTDVMTCEEANLHLIEDRMLTMEMLTNSADLVSVNYVHDAEFETDVPLDFNTFLKQRRRWYNGNLISSYLMLSDAPRVITRGCKFGFWGFFDMTALMCSNIRNILDMMLLQALLVEGLYIWGGIYMMGAGILCYFGIIFGSMCMDSKKGSKVILGFAIALSLLVLAANFCYYHYMNVRLTEKLATAREKYNRWRIEQPTDELKIFVLWFFSIGQNFYFVFPFIQKPWVGWHRLRYYIPAIFLIPFLASVFPVTLIYSFANINDVSWGNRPKIENATSREAKELAKKDA